MGPPFQCSRDSGVLGISVTRLCGVSGAGRVQRWGGEEGQQENGSLEVMQGAQRASRAESREARDPPPRASFSEAGGAEGSASTGPTCRPDPHGQREWRHSGQGLSSKGDLE